MGNTEYTVAEGWKITAIIHLFAFLIEQIPYTLLKGNINPRNQGLPFLKTSIAQNPLEEKSVQRTITNFAKRQMWLLFGTILFTFDHACYIFALCRRVQWLASLCILSHLQTSVEEEMKDNFCGLF
jgi:hypothetical protein